MKFFEFIQAVDPNIELLDQQLKSQIVGLDGIQYYPQTKKLIVVSFDDNQESLPIEIIVNAHDPTQKIQRELDLDQVKTGLQILRDYIVNVSPTNAESIQAIKVLSRAVIYMGKYIHRMEN